MTTPNRRNNPRFDRSFSLKLDFGDVSLPGRSVAPSAYGCNVEISASDYQLLLDNPAWWENERRIIVTTTLNELPAQVKILSVDKDVKYLLSLKLLDSRTWYS